VLSRFKRSEEERPHKAFKEKVTTDNGTCTSNHKFMLDSGCSNHITGIKGILQGYQEINPIEIEGASGTKMYATGKGEIVSEEMILVDVWYVKGISESLISINQLANRGATIKI
jgi:hypothetical protein